MYKDHHYEEDTHEGSATAALVMGLFGVITWLLPIIGIPVAITGIILGFRGSQYSRAIVGVMLCSISLTAASVNSYMGSQKSSSSYNQTDSTTDYPSGYTDPNYYQ